jgi:hypothetical protein
VAFFLARWRGRVPLGRLFWRDMLLVGSAINVASALAALMLLAHGASMAVGAGVHFAPVPYNLFLFAAVWRASQRKPATRACAGCWLVGTTVV